MPMIFRMAIGGCRGSFSDLPAMIRRLISSSRFRLPAMLLALAGNPLVSSAGVEVDYDLLGKSLGGWKGKRAQTAEYELSGSNYRTFRPEITPTPEGGIFISVRIDYRRGMFASDDFATLEMTFGPDGKLTSTSGSIAIQGKRINSDVIRSGTAIGKDTGAPGAAVKMGGEMVASLTEKLSRENLVEAGRVTFPAAVRHNYNRVFQAVRFVPDAPPAAAGEPVAKESLPATPGATLEISPKNSPVPPAAPTPAAPTPAAPTPAAPTPAAPTPAAPASGPPPP